MTPTEFKAKYRTAIAPKFDKIKDPTPELLKAIIDLERMVSELQDCSCGGAPVLPYPPPFLPKIPNWYSPGDFPRPMEVWCRTGDRNGVVG